MAIYCTFPIYQPRHSRLSASAKKHRATDRSSRPTTGGLPLIWLIWQIISATQTVDLAISKATLIHFGSCIAAFYLGIFVLARMRLAKLALWGAALGLVIYLIDASRVHFGGLENTR